LDQPKTRAALGTGLGVPHIYFDKQHNLLFVAGRGEMNVDVYGYDRNSDLPLGYIEQYRGAQPQKGFNFLPKQALDVNIQEIRRAVRLNNQNHIEYISFKVPSRTGAFNPELYPEFPANEPTVTSEEWL